MDTDTTIPDGWHQAGCVDCGFPLPGRALLMRDEHATEFALDGQPLDDAQRAAECPDCGRQQDAVDEASVTDGPVDAILIPEQGPFLRASLPRTGGLDRMQALCGGGIVQAIDFPGHAAGVGATCYVNEEGKYRSDLAPNLAATDVVLPMLRFGDVVRGPMLVVGFAYPTGEHAASIPEGAARRVRLIEREAGR